MFTNFKSDMSLQFTNTHADENTPHSSNKLPRAITLSLPGSFKSPDRAMSGLSSNGDDTQCQCSKNVNTEGWWYGAPPSIHCWTLSKLQYRVNNVVPPPATITLQDIQKLGLVPSGLCMYASLRVVCTASIAGLQSQSWNRAILVIFFYRVVHNSYLSDIRQLLVSSPYQLLVSSPYKLLVSSPYQLLVSSPYQLLVSSPYLCSAPGFREGESNIGRGERLWTTYV